MVYTFIKINKKIFRMGMEARPLLVVLSTMLIVGFLSVLLLGFFGWFVVFLILFGFIKVKNYLTSEIEKGNTAPIDNLIQNLDKPKHVRNDDVVLQLKLKVK